MNKSRVIDALNGIRTTDSFDAKHVASYLWLWTDLNALGSPRGDIENELEKQDKKSTNWEEHAVFIKNNYKPLLDKYYKEIKKEVDKMLSDGYNNLDKYFKNAK